MQRSKTPCSLALAAGLCLALGAASVTFDARPVSVIVQADSLEAAAAAVRAAGGEVTHELGYELSMVGRRSHLDERAHGARIGQRLGGQPAGRRGRRDER